MILNNNIKPTCGAAAALSNFGSWWDSCSCNVSRSKAKNSWQSCCKNIHIFIQHLHCQNLKLIFTNKF